MISGNVSDTLKWLARGPRNVGKAYSGYVINGFRFHTKDSEKSRQNSGILVEANTICRSSAKDNTQVVGKVMFYGVLREIMLLDYNSFKVPLFKCDWANIVNGIKREEGFTLVNLHDGLSQFENDPYIFASQAKQVFYSRENESSNWYIVMQAPLRGYVELQTYDEVCHETFTTPNVSTVDDNEIDDEQYEREGVEGIFCAV